MRFFRIPGKDLHRKVVAIYHPMTNTQPMIIFLHYWGRRPADKLEAGFKAALDELGTGGAR